jgi:hypothetical protein
MESNSCNYNSAATDSAACEFALGCDTCSGPTDGSGVVMDNDADDDGSCDADDAFPNDANETLDSDGDGVGNNADAFPQDSTETVDSDGDNVGDNSDAFPNDANETLDSDNDGLGNNADTLSGCTDNSACNYNSSSTLNTDNSGCTYLDGVCQTCVDGVVVDNDADNDSYCDAND